MKLEKSIDEQKKIFVEEAQIKLDKIGGSEIEKTFILYHTNKLIDYICHKSDIPPHYAKKILKMTLSMLEIHPNTKNFD